MRLSTGMVVGMTQPKRLTDRDRFAAVIRSYADAVHLAQTPTPTSIIVWRHRINRTEFLEYADRNAAKIELRCKGTPAGDVPEGQRPDYALIMVQIGHDLLPSGTWFHIYLSCRDTDDESLAAYAAHNAECLTPEGADA